MMDANDHARDASRASCCWCQSNRWLVIGFVAVAHFGICHAEPDLPAAPPVWIGYTQMRTNLPGGRAANVTTSRAYVVRADGRDGREVGAHLVDGANTWTQFAGWSPDGEWVAFVAGVRENCHPYIVRRDGSGLKKVADRGGYQGWVLFLDVPDFHEGSSDVPTWSADSQSLYYTAAVGDAVELMRVSLDGHVQQLSHSPPGVLHYHPAVSPDGTRVLFGPPRDATAARRRGDGASCTSQLRHDRHLLTTRPEPSFSTD